VSVELAHSEHIANRQKVELCQATAASGVQREENWPCQTQSNEANDAEDLEVAEEEEAIQGGVAKDDGIRDLDERYDPVEPAGRQRRTEFTVLM